MRCLTATLILTLAMPSPAFALKAQAPPENSGLEELRATLGADAGLEEPTGDTGGGLLGGPQTRREFLKTLAALTRLGTRLGALAEALAPPPSPEPPVWAPYQEALPLAFDELGLSAGENEALIIDLTFDREVAKVGIVVEPTRWAESLARSLSTSLPGAHRVAVAHAQWGETIQQRLAVPGGRTALIQQLREHVRAEITVLESSRIQQSYKETMGREGWPLPEYRALATMFDTLTEPQIAEGLGWAASQHLQAVKTAIEHLAAAAAKVQTAQQSVASRDEAGSPASDRTTPPTPQQGAVKSEPSGILGVLLTPMPKPNTGELLEAWSQRIHAPQGPGLVSPVEETARRLRTLLRNYHFAQQAALWDAFVTAVPSVRTNPYQTAWLTDVLEVLATLREMQGPPAEMPIQQALTLLRTAPQPATGLEEPTQPAPWDQPMDRREFLQNTARTIAALTRLGSEFGALADLFAPDVPTPTVPPWDPYRDVLRQTAESRIGLTAYDTGRIWTLAKEDAALGQLLSGNPLDWGLGMQRLSQLLEGAYQRARAVQQQLASPDGRASLMRELRSQRFAEVGSLTDAHLAEGFLWAVGEKLRAAQSSLARLDIEMKEYWALVVQKVQAAAARYGRESPPGASPRPLILGTRQSTPDALEQLWGRGVSLTDEQIVTMASAQAAGANEVVLIPVPSLPAQAAETTIALYALGELYAPLTQQVLGWPAWPSGEAAVTFVVQTPPEGAPALPAIAVRLASQPRVAGVPNLVVESPEALSRLTAALVAAVARSDLPADQDLPVLAALPLTVDGREVLALFL